jgi:D-inositol-3-phosphate glycosyltransferase
MKIMMIETLGDGGIAHYTYNLLNALVSKPENVCLFTTKKYEFANEYLQFKVYKRMFRVASYIIRKIPALNEETTLPSIIRRTIKVMEYPINTIEALLLTLFKKIKIVHLQSVNLVELLMITAFKLFNRKVIYTIHNVMPRHGQLKNYHVLIYRLMYLLCDQIIIHSEKGKDEIIELFKVNKNKIHVIPHGDYKFFVPEKGLSKKQAKHRLGISSDTKTLLFFGAIRENKGLRNILVALPEIKKRIDNVKLLIVGEPWEDYGKYKKVIAEKQIEKDVFEKLDYVPNEDVPLYFFATDVVVLPYNEITQSGILQIAYAFGKPVVAADLGGFREAVEDGKNGYLVPLADTEKLAEKCIDILSDDKNLEKMGTYSRYLSDTKYSWDSIATKTKHVYELCLID